MPDPSFAHKAPRGPAQHGRVHTTSPLSSTSSKYVSPGDKLSFTAESLVLQAPPALRSCSVPKTCSVPASRLRARAGSERRCAAPAILPSLGALQFGPFSLIRPRAAVAGPCRRAAYRRKTKEPGSSRRHAVYAALGPPSPRRLAGRLRAAHRPRAVRPSVPWVTLTRPPAHPTDSPVTALSSSPRLIPHSTVSCLTRGLICLAHVRQGGPPTRGVREASVRRAPVGRRGGHGRAAAR